MLISDFQKTGWSGSEDVHFPEGMTLTPVSVASPTRANLSVPSVTFARSSFSGQERITVTAGVANKGDEAANDVPVTLDDRRPRDRDQAVDDRARNASASVTFAPFTLAEPNVRGVVQRRHRSRCRPTTRSTSC